MKIRFDVLDKIKEIKPNCLLIVTNQGGINLGFVNRINFSIKLNYICTLIREYCNCRCHAKYCTTNDISDPYRKPNTGMLEDLMELHIGNNIDYIKSVSLMIGDASGKKGQFSDSDKKTAENFGIDYMDVDDFVSMEKKYKLTEESIDYSGRKLYCIEALKDFADIKKGDKGGYVQSETNLSQEDNCWVYGDAKVYDSAHVFDDAQVYGSAKVYGNARVCDNAKVYNKAQVYGSARVCGYAKVCDNAKVYDKAQISGNTKIYGNAQINSGAKAYKDSEISGREYNKRVVDYVKLMLQDNR